MFLSKICKNNYWFQKVIILIFFLSYFFFFFIQFFSHHRWPYIYHVNRSDSRQIWQISLTKGSNSINNVRERRSIQLFRRSWFDPRGRNAQCRVHDIVSVFVRVQLYSTAYIPVSNITGYKLWPWQGGRSKTRTTTAFGMRVYEKHASWVKWWFVLEPWKCVVEFSKRSMLSWNFEGKGNGVAKKKAQKNWAVVSPLNDRAARGELRGDALMIGTRGTYRAIFEEIKRIPKPQLTVQGKWYRTVDEFFTKLGKKCEVIKLSDW